MNMKWFAVLVILTPAMVLCLLDDLEEAASSKKRETSMSKVFGAVWIKGERAG